VFEDGCEGIWTEIEKVVGTGTSMQYDDGQECKSNHIEDPSRVRSMVEVDDVEEVFFTHATNIE